MYTHSDIVFNLYILDTFCLTNIRYKCLIETTADYSSLHPFVYRRVSGFQDSLKGMGSTEPNWIWVCKYCSDV